MADQLANSLCKLLFEESPRLDSLDINLLGKLTSYNLLAVTHKEQIQVLRDRLWFLDEDDIIQLCLEVVLDEHRGNNKEKDGHTSGASNQSHNRYDSLNKELNGRSSTKRELLLRLTRLANNSRPRYKADSISYDRSSNRQEEDSYLELQHEWNKLDYWGKYLLYLYTIEEYSVRDIEKLCGYAKSSINEELVSLLKRLDIRRNDEGNQD